MDINKVLIVGAGTMGSDIALDLASYNFQVVVKDIDSNILNKSEQSIRKNFRMYQMMKPHFRQMKVEDILGRITFTTDYDFQNVKLVVENIPEDWELKKQLYRELRTYCDDHTIYAVNTSCISITQVAALLPDPSKVIGAHFMNPVPLKELVEVVKAYHTSDQTVDTLKSFLNSIGKSAVVVNDSTGFVANRLSHLFMNEAAFLVQEGVAAPKEIDLIFKKGYGHAMGPLETADLIGLDTVLNSLNILYDSYQDSKFRSCQLLNKMVSAGVLGKKSGKGFYQY